LVLPRTHGLGPEVNELELKSLPRANYSFDKVEPAPEGELGGGAL
jgi:hypothetical protein